MRFVNPETVQIPLKSGGWIEVKKELSVGDVRAYRTAGFGRMGDRADGNGRDIDINWVGMAFARVQAYLTDWSAEDAQGKRVPVTEQSIRNLDEDSFQEIDAAIVAHIEKVDPEKNEQGTNGSSTATALS